MPDQANAADATITDAPKAAKPTHVEKLTEVFIAELRERGIVHTFEWMAGWFDRVAQAQLEDELDRMGSDYPTREMRDEATNLHLLQLMSQMAQSATNTSSLPTSNMMRHARLAAVARVFNRNSRSFGGHRQREQGWDALLSRANAAMATSQETPAASAQG